MLGGVSISSSSVFIGSVDRNVYAFALPAAAPPPTAVASVRVNSPSADDNWTVGQKYSITWNTSGPVSRVDVSISRDGGSTWQSVAEGIDANSEAVTMKAKKPRSELMLVRVTDSTNSSVAGQSGMFHIR
jgi:hypothetical protein